MSECKKQRRDDERKTDFMKAPSFLFVLERSNFILSHVRRRAPRWGVIITSRPLTLTFEHHATTAPPPCPLNMP